MNEASVESLLTEAPGPDQSAASHVRERARWVLRPEGALARLDELAIWLASWQRTATPRVDRPGLLVFVSDHGVAEEGVSAYPAEVTAAMLEALQEGVATASAMASALGACMEAIDVGVGQPTENLTRAPAMSFHRFGECFEVGRKTVTDLDVDLLVLGEMGIANTTAAAAVTALMLKCSPRECTGRGTGVDEATFLRKIAAVEAARRRVGTVPPLECLRQVGGAEMAALAGAALEARLRSIPLVLDGFVVTASVAPLEFLRPGALDHTVAGHLSPEPGHRLLLEALDKRPLLDLEMRLGEGTGALAAVPLLKLAAAVVTGVATFEERGLKRT